MCPVCPVEMSRLSRRLLAHDLKEVRQKFVLFCKHEYFGVFVGERCLIWMRLLAHNWKLPVYTCVSLRTVAFGRFFAYKQIFVHVWSLLPFNCY